MNTQASLRRLQRALLNKSKLSVLQSDGCKQISIAIFLETANYVSATSLKRIFGLIPAFNDTPLRTMDIVSNYAGFASWRDLQASNCKSNELTAAPFSPPTITAVS